MNLLIYKKFMKKKLKKVEYYHNIRMIFYFYKQIIQVNIILEIILF